MSGQLASLNAKLDESKMENRRQTEMARSQGELLREVVSRISQIYEFMFDNEDNETPQPSNGDSGALIAVDDGQRLRSKVGSLKGMLTKVTGLAASNITQKIDEFSNLQNKLIQIVVRHLKQPETRHRFITTSGVMNVCVTLCILLFMGVFWYNDAKEFFTGFLKIFWPTSVVTTVIVLLYGMEMNYRSTNSVASKELSTALEATLNISLGSKNESTALVLAKDVDTIQNKLSVEDGFEADLWNLNYILWGVVFVFSYMLIRFLETKKKWINQYRRRRAVDEDGNRNIKKWICDFCRNTISGYIGSLLTSQNVGTGIGGIASLKVVYDHYKEITLSHLVIVGVLVPTVISLLLMLRDYVSDPLKIEEIKTKLTYRRKNEDSDLFDIRMSNVFRAIDDSVPVRPADADQKRD
jgi:hypothetical protein